MKPNKDLRKEIELFAKENNIQAGIIATTVGSLKELTIRLASAEIIETYKENFEIVSLVGTLSNKDSHLHISAANNSGKVIGGHLKYDSIINTTAEIVILEIENLVFDRAKDSETGYEELMIKNFNL